MPTPWPSCSDPPTCCTGCSSAGIGCRPFGQTEGPSRSNYLFARFGLQEGGEMRRRLVLLATAAAVLTTVVLGSAGQAGAVPIRETAPTAGLSRMVIVAFTYLPDPVV